MKKEIFVINGSGGVGKDTFVEYCREFTNVKNISTIDKIKEVAKLLGWNGAKEEKDRKLLSDLKQLSIEYNDGPTKYILDEYEKFKNSDEKIMFIHVREPEEIKKLVDRIHCKTLLITSSRVKKIISNKADANVLEYNYDENVKNDGSLDELKENVKKFISKYYWYFL